MKADWLTGMYNTAQLEEKYKVERNRIACIMRFHWWKEAKKLGIKPAKEPKFKRRSYGRGVWEKMRLDFLSGKTFEQLSAKYNIPEFYIQFMAKRRGWHIEQEKMFLDGKRRINDSIQSTADELAVRYTGFMRAAIEQIDVMTDRLKIMSAEKTCTPERLKAMVDSLGSLITMGMKIYGVEKPQTQVNNQFIRLDVMDSSSASTMNQLARTLDVKIA